VLSFILAQTASPSPGAGTSGGLGGLVIFLPLILVMVYMFRKQGRQRRMHLEQIQSLSIGDEVETIAGMFGRIRKLSDNEVWVELAPGTEVKMARMAIRRRVIPTDEGQPGAS